MKNPDAFRIFSPEFFGGKYKLLKKQQQNQNKSLEKCQKKHFLKRSLTDVVKDKFDREDIAEGMLI